MTQLLHITNGRAIIPSIEAAGVPGRIQPWDDVLHEGPVPAGLDPAALRQVRAEFLGPFVAGPAVAPGVIVSDFTARDRALDDAIDETTAADEIVLWLEHDLYDQLQLIQILDRLPVDGGPRVTAVPGDDYLGLQPDERFPGLFRARREITREQRIAARAAWEAFRAIDPRAIVDVLAQAQVLPHLGPALRRHLQQFPSIENGLSRTEQYALEALATGVTRVDEVYVAANHKREAAVFMGDLGFLSHMSPLLHRPRPLLKIATGDSTAMTLQDELVLTDDGRRVLDREADRVRLCGIDRWLGGVHLTGHGPVWRCDGTTLRYS